MRYEQFDYFIYNPLLAHNNIYKNKKPTIKGFRSVNTGGREYGEGVFSRERRASMPFARGHFLTGPPQSRVVHNTINMLRVVINPNRIRDLHDPMVHKAFDCPSQVALKYVEARASYQKAVRLLRSCNNDPCHQDFSTESLQRHYDDFCTSYISMNKTIKDKG